MNQKLIRHWLVPWAACACLAAGPARAQYYYGGVDLTWNDCGSSGTKDLSSACGSDTTALKLHGSFTAPPGLDAVFGYKVTVGAVDAGDIPWWDYSAGGCRDGLWSLKANAPGASCNPIGTALPQDPTFVRHPNGGAVFSAVFTLLERAALPEGQTFYAFTLTLRRPGPTLCDGCCLPTCLMMTLELYQDSGITIMESDLPGGATWQGGVCGVHQATAASSSGGCLPTPTTKSTWGSIKTLYR